MAVRALLPNERHQAAPSILCIKVCQSALQENCQPETSRKNSSTVGTSDVSSMKPCGKAPFDMTCDLNRIDPVIRFLVQ